MLENEKERMELCWGVVLLLNVVRGRTLFLCLMSISCCLHCGAVLVDLSCDWREGVVHKAEKSGS